jgi:hypothetical protein
MYEIPLIWYYIPALMLVSSIMMVFGEMKKWTFGEWLLFTVLAVICLYAGLSQASALWVQ